MAFLNVEDMYGAMEVLVFPTICEKYNHMLTEGKIVKIHGRISFTEEKEPKLICDYLTAPPTELEMNSRNPEENKKPAFSNTTESSRAGLYIRVPKKDSPEYKKAIQYIEVFDGTTDLYVYYNETKTLVKAPSRLRVDPNTVLIKALKEVLGEKNVAIKK